MIAGGSDPGRGARISRCGVRVYDLDMTSHAPCGETPEQTLARVRDLILGGGSLLLDRMTDAELVAMQDLLFYGEAEIINSACRPYLIARLDRDRD